MNDRLKEIMVNWENVDWWGIDKDDVDWLIEKVVRYEKALGDINEYIPTKDFRKDVHHLKTIADNALR